MLHMLATLVSLFVLFGAGTVIASSLAERIDAVGGALGFPARQQVFIAARSRPARVRWYNVRTVSLSKPVNSRFAA
jgi:hypothetical protein